MFFKSKDAGETRVYQAEGTFFEGSSGQFHSVEEQHIVAAAYDAIGEAFFTAGRQMKREAAMLWKQSGTVLDATVIDDIVSGS
jgi:hypothetical protein